MTEDLYFIRYYNLIGDARFAPPRSRPTVRRSLNGVLCVLAFAPGNAPKEWKDGRTAAEMKAFLELPEHEGVWWTKEEL
jgi:hypothetical protein